MNPFAYQRATAPNEALHAIATKDSKFLGGGTNLIDLMKYGVEQPTTLIDITHLDLTQITEAPHGGLMVGALVRNSDLANHQQIRESYPLLSQALLSGASPQLRNMATTGGNLMQRTRCYYFMDTAFPACNKRAPGSGCAAIKGINRIHAILGQSDNGSEAATTCIATNPSDMNVALSALNATIHIQGATGKRTLPIADFHRLPGTTPQLDTNLKPGELITAIEIPASKFSANSHYLKVRDRQSYAFALVSVAAGLDLSDRTIQSAGLALGGVAHKPWRSLDAERFLVGTVATPDAFKKAADIALAGAKGYEHNTFKIELAKQSIVRALTLATAGTTGA
jgi:xanthine dehydrogenase YagS FAD-binding subunit